MKGIGIINLVTSLLLIQSVHTFYALVGNLVTFLINLTRLGPHVFPTYPSTVDNIVDFDFIVIGSGPTGSVVANRLTEVAEWNILLLESGEEPSFITKIPIASGALHFTKYNWGYKSEQQDGFCRGCIDGRMELPHGHALGGSSIINYMIFVRGNKLDYDKWEADGNPGWSFNDVFPYFLKSEDAHIAINDSSYHNQGGYLTITDVPYRTKAADAYVKAAQEAGYQYTDYNGETQLGVSYVQATLRNGERCSAEQAFLRSVKQRKNLKIQTGSRVVRILIDSYTKLAYGVEYVRRGKTHFAYSNKEVILSAGALNSPQVLMLSGIGPEKHLHDLGIPLIRNLPVGEVMYDHPTFPGITFRLNESISVNLLESILNPSTYLKYAQGKGPLTLIDAVEVMTYIKTSVSTDPDPSYPDMELFMAGASFNADYGILFRKIFNIPSKTYDKVWKPLEGLPTFQVFPMLVRPKSRGYMELKSKDPVESPKFFANYLSDPENVDIKTFIAAIREIQKINQSPAIQKFGSIQVDTPLPGCDEKVFDTDEYWECALRSLISSIHHQVATCKMGPESDPEAVVDSTLKVYGITGLRVADASIIPHPITAHMVGPTYMLGEKAASIIKKDWKQQ